MTGQSQKSDKPMITLAIGDPAGIGVELAARLIADPEIRAAANVIVVGDRRVLEQGHRQAGLTPDFDTIDASATPKPGPRPILLDLGHLDPAAIKPSVAQSAGGAFALRNYQVALELTRDGKADAVCFTPFNKAAMRMARPSYDDEIAFTCEVLGLPENHPAREFNILEGLWNARITSHVPLSAVAGLITQDAVLGGLRLTDRALREAGLAAPRIAVAGLNPHAGDGGCFGHEDDQIIAPAVVAGKREGIDATGPFPPDIVFVRATKGEFDAVLTMYHDQGQIAMKLLGFERGVTFMGGFPFPICTPAHGSAYDIVNKGVANPGAARAALLLAARMANQRKARRAAA